MDWSLDPGIHGLLGPNGSGKTTFLKTLLGFHVPTAGSAHVLGMDVRVRPLGVRRLVGYMAENDVIVPGLNAAQTVRLAAELCGVPAAHAYEAAAEALFAVGLKHEALEDPQKLSTGQRQKMKLAAALVHAPRLLFLDEPTNGLDAQARRRMLALIKEIAEEKQISVILSTHILPDVEAVCEDAIVLRDGHIAGRERVRGREVQRTAKATWHNVQVLGDPSGFANDCQRLGYEVRDTADGFQVASTTRKLFALAKKRDEVLLRCVPATTGVEDAILAHMEDA